jgi:5-formyltetrahydrofolate cyclo-ligase
LLDSAATIRYIHRVEIMDSDEIAKAKARTRRMVSDVLASLTPSRRRAASIALAQKLANLPAVRQAQTLMVFLSLPTEIDTWPVIRWAWREGKRVAIPRIEAGGAGQETPLSQRPMVAVLLAPADGATAAGHPAVRPGPLGILDAPDAPAVPLAQIDVVLVPCQAADRSGNRLGKGGGFYDRLLADPDLRAARIVVAFHEQVLDEIPTADWDRPVPMIVTDTEVLTFDT